MKLYYDLHIHSALSPCAEDEMTPNNIVNMALIKELDAIAIADHNAVDNVEAAMKVADGTGLIVIPGVEIQTLEDIHVLCLFKSLENMKAFMLQFDPYLPKLAHREKFGTQLIMDENDEIVSNKPYSLMFASNLGIARLREMVLGHSGAFVPAHVNKSSMSLLSNLGFFPEDLHIVAVEEHLSSRKVDLGNFKVLHNSDAHNLAQISERENFIEVDCKSIECIFDYLEN